MTIISRIKLTMMREAPPTCSKASLILAFKPCKRIRLAHGENAAASTTNVIIIRHLQMVGSLVHLVCNFFNHHPLQSASRDESHDPTKSMRDASSNVTHLRFDLGVHIKRNVLQAGYTLADLIKLLVQFSEKE